MLFAPLLETLQWLSQALGMTSIIMSLASEAYFVCCLSLWLLSAHHWPSPSFLHMFFLLYQHMLLPLPGMFSAFPPGGFSSVSRVWSQATSSAPSTFFQVPKSQAQSVLHFILTLIVICVVLMFTFPARWKVPLSVLFSHRWHLSFLIVTLHQHFYVRTISHFMNLGGKGKEPKRPSPALLTFPAPPLGRTQTIPPPTHP